MELQSERVAVIDADSICFIAHWDSDNKTFDKSLEDILKSTDQIISNILITIGVSKYIGFVGFGKCTERNAVYPEYKANRKDREPLKYLKDVKNHMIDKWKFIALHGIEADDMVNSVRVKVDGSIICAIDKDLLMLEGTHYNYKKNEWVTVTEEEADLYFWKSMIIGDSADNIKGLEGKGKSFADKLLLNIDDVESMRNIVFQEYINQYGEYHGISKFYQNYVCLKIKDDFPATGFLNPINVDVDNLVI
jgi:5'-3' exonuclease